MAKFSMADLRILPCLRWSQWQQLVTVGLATNGQYLHVAAVTRSSLLVKLKSDETGHPLKVASGTLSCFVGMFLHFFKNAHYFLFY